MSKAGSQNENLWRSHFKLLTKLIDFFGDDDDFIYMTAGLYMYIGLVIYSSELHVKSRTLGIQILHPHLIFLMKLIKIRLNGLTMTTVYYVYIY
jgi:hypothetical protein